MREVERGGERGREGEREGKGERGWRRRERERGKERESEGGGRTNICTILNKVHCVRNIYHGIKTHTSHGHQ